MAKNRDVAPIFHWYRHRTERKRQTAVWKVLNTLKLNQEMSADGVYKQFGWQISGPLFSDVDQVEDPLRAMLQQGLVQFTPSGSWKLARAGPRVDRFAS